MGFQLSPGVNVSEIDLTTVIPSVSTTAGAIVGEFVWGPVNKRILVDSEITLVNRFGKPDSNTYVSFLSAANFLAYGNNLRVVRVVNETLGASANNATSVGTGVLIKNEDDYENNFSANTYTDFGPFYARYPGELGNNLDVVACANTAGFSDWIYTTANNDDIDLSTYFDSAPGTSLYASSVGGSSDELHIAVIDRTGKISGTVGTVLETFSHVSKAFDAKNDDGSPNYYVTKIFNNSEYIYVAAHWWAGWGATAVGTDFGTATPNIDRNPSELSGGRFIAATTANYTSGWDLFASAEQVDVSLLIGGNASEVADALQEHIADIATSRKDSVAFLSPTRALVVDNPVNTADELVNYRNNTLTINSSYAFMDSGWKYQFDKYNNVYRYVPLNGDTAGLCVYTDNVRDPWWSPAGFNRGIIKNVVKLAWNPTKTDRDTIYPAGVNPVVAFPGEGVVLFGDRTMQSKPSAFDRINVRRLFIVLEKAIAVAAKYSLFEFNDEFTRAAFVALVEPFLRDVKGRRGIYDYRVVCDTTNNTPEVIDSNRFIGDIYIKPARSINFIQLNFIAVRTGVEFSEIVGKF
jgi:phage tail sheath protein FI